jgi:hypothetical protein
MNLEIFIPIPPLLPNYDMWQFLYFISSDNSFFESLEAEKIFKKDEPITRITDTPTRRVNVTIQLRYHFDGSIVINNTERIHNTICMGVPILKKSTY